MSKSKTENRGRPKIQIDKEQLERLMGFRPSLYDCAGFFKCGHRTVQRFIKDEYDMEFLEFRKTYGAGAKLSVIQKCYTKATSGDNEMIKFYLINVAGWTNGYSRDHRFDEDEAIDDIEWYE